MYSSEYKEVQKIVVDAFNSIVISDKNTNRSNWNTILMERGIVIDFIPTSDEVKFLKSLFKLMQINTLFSKEERINCSVEDLLYKQFLHYIEVYGLGTPGVFNLEVKQGVIIPIRYVRGISFNTLTDLIHKLIYSNAPIKDVNAIVKVIRYFEIPYDITMVANNEVKMALFVPGRDVLTNGDDVVRYIVYKHTGKTMLIKDKATIQMIKTISSFDRNVLANLLEKYAYILASVFNRHKKILLTLKSKGFAKQINKISRLSKTHHRPLYQSISKRFLATAVKIREDNKVRELVNQLSLRDKFKMLNLISYKVEGHREDIYVIRNGKIFIDSNPTSYNRSDLVRIESIILESLSVDLEPLRHKKILLDQMIDYGLPVSRKQTLGQLPYGTRIVVNSNDPISVGIHWKGHADIDLSAIDENGKRIGWGSYYGYTDTKIVYSGDVTYGGDGAMEFMTSPNNDETYSVMFNMFHGESNYPVDIVVGTGGKKQWINNVVVSAEMIAESKQMVIGTVVNNEFVVYGGRVNDSRVSGGSQERVLVNRGKAYYYTVKVLFDLLQIKYDDVAETGVDYDHNLQYNQFTLDKLETLLLN